MRKQIAAERKVSSSDEAFRRMWSEARKDPHFLKEMKAFVKASTSVYKLPRNFFSKTA